MIGLQLNHFGKQQTLSGWAVVRLSASPLAASGQASPLAEGPATGKRNCQVLFGFFFFGELWIIRWPLRASSVFENRWTSILPTKPRSQAPLPVGPAAQWPSQPAIHENHKNPDNPGKNTILEFRGSGGGAGGGGDFYCKYDEKNSLKAP